jgi:hypothetical protein
MSSEKQFEDIENKIKEAAENNHIVFEEESWKKMEVLLDKEDKRKPFFWLWFLVPIVLVSAYCLFTLSKDNNKSLVKNINENKVEKIIANSNTTTQMPTGEQPISIDDKASTPDNNNINKNINSKTKSAPIIGAQNKNSYTAIKKAKLAISLLSNKAKYISTDRGSKAIKSNSSKNKINITQTSKTKTSIQNAEVIEEQNMFEKTTDDNKKDIVASQKKNKDIVAEIKNDSNTSITKNSTSKKEKKKSSKILPRFYLLGAIGADIGSTKLFSFSNSSFSTKYGASIGYSINKKLSVQAGFYASKKKYIAAPEDYNIKAGSYLNTFSITKVEAACLIYELPIALQYQFLQKKSFSVYAGAGVSSYIMKKEDYNYFYKRYNMNLSREYSYTGNQHLFSNALLSVGVEKNISKKFALQLEPTISIPLIGVGDGAVKLFSTSLLLGIKYKPFNK